MMVMKIMMKTLMMTTDKDVGDETTLLSIDEDVVDNEDAVE